MSAGTATRPRGRPRSAAKPRVAGAKQAGTEQAGAEPVSRTHEQPVLQTGDQWAAQLFPLMDSERKAAILEALCDGGELPSIEIYRRIKLGPAMGARHLAALRAAGLVAQKRRGTSSYCQITPRGHWLAAALRAFRDEMDSYPIET